MSFGRLAVPTRVAFVSAVFGLLTGCGGSHKKNKIWVTSFPSFYSAKLKDVAVLPFGNRTRQRGAGLTISDRVSAALTQNGTYRVYTRQYLADILAERDLADAGIIDGDRAVEIGRLKSVQALICGACTQYDGNTRNETRYNTVPVFGQDAQGQTVITGWNQVPYLWTRHEANVACHVVVVDTATGQQIGAVNLPSQYWAEGSPPDYSLGDVMQNAEQMQINYIVSSIAVTRQEIKLKGTVLKTATELYDNKWDWERRLVPSDENFFVVVRLPIEAKRNNFRITIIPDGGRDVLSEQSFVWTGEHESFGFKFPLQALIDGHGLGKFQAKLYSGPEPIATYDFEVVEKR